MTQLLLEQSKTYNIWELDHGLEYIHIVFADLQRITIA